MKKRNVCYYCVRDICCDITVDHDGETGNNSINANKKCVKIMNDISGNFIIFQHLIITSHKLKLQDILTGILLLWKYQEIVGDLTHYFSC